MDASQYLKNHGWQGSGHSLDGNGRGLKKPLLVSKKVDVLGVGLNKHAAVSDQWWLRAYDQGLQTLGTGKESALAQAQKHGVNRGGLYGRFVKGEGVPGTLGQYLVPTSTSDAAKLVVEVKKVPANGMLPTPQDSDAQEEKAERKRKRSDKSEEKKSKRKTESGKEKKSTSTNSDDKAAKKAKKDAKKAAKGTKSGTTTADASGAEEELDSEKRTLYAKRAAEKGVSLETYIKRRQEKYAAKKDEKRK